MQSTLFVKGDFLSENLRAYRQKNKLTQQAFGAMLGVSAQAVSKWERRRSYPDILLLPLIASLSGHSIEALLTTRISF